MSNAWELTRELLTVMDNIDRAVSKKAKARNIDESLMLDAEITRLECRMFEIKNILRSKQI